MRKSPGQGSPAHSPAGPRFLNPLLASLFFCPSVSVKGLLIPEGPEISLTFTSRIPLFPKIHTRSPGEPRQLFWRVEGKVGLSGARGHLITTTARLQKGRQSMEGSGITPVFPETQAQAPRVLTRVSRPSEGRGTPSCRPAAPVPGAEARPSRTAGWRKDARSWALPGTGRQVKARMRFRGCGLRAASPSRGPAGSPPRKACVRFRRLPIHPEQRGLGTTAWGERNKKRRCQDF